MTEIKNVALMGASGNLGPSILKGLLDEGFNVTVLSRPSSTATFPSAVKVVKTDYSPESLVQAFTGQDAVVSTLGATALEDQIITIDAAVKAGVSRFLPSEFGSNTRDDRALQIGPDVFGSKVKIAKYLELKARNHDDFSYTNMITGPFFDFCLVTGFFGYDLKGRRATIWDAGDRPFSTSTLSTVGKAVARVLKHPAETKNQYVDVASFTTTQQEILAVLEKTTGQTWEITKVTWKDEVREGRELMRRGDMAGIAKLIMGTVYHPEDIGNAFPEAAEKTKKLLGLPEEDVAEVVKAVVQGQ
ncbi:MAG: hypothetical protein M1817_000005 [Caeruleum heppii]|nr:MAG: hypothetical protein M1817_000005 [Caeruleum heppii]